MHPLTLLSTGVTKVEAFALFIQSSLLGLQQKEIDLCIELCAFPNENQTPMLLPGRSNWTKSSHLCQRLYYLPWCIKPKFYRDSEFKQMWKPQNGVFSGQPCYKEVLWCIRQKLNNPTLIQVYGKWELKTTGVIKVNKHFKSSLFWKDLKNKNWK